MFNQSGKKKRDHCSHIFSNSTTAISPDLKNLVLQRQADKNTFFKDCKLGKIYLVILNNVLQKFFLESI
jgi:hypothetical protein